MIRVVLLAAVVGCYHPNAELPCTITCDSTDRCPGDLTCSGGLCTTADVTCGPAGGDGGLPCFGHSTPNGFGQICITPPTKMVQLDEGVVIDTTNGVGCTLGTLTGGTAPDVPICYIAGVDVTVEPIPFNGSIHPSGANPLVLIATQTIDVQGILDVAGHLNATAPPAGGAGSHCVPLAPLTAPVGGPGGSFATSGGAGGKDTSGDAASSAGAIAQPNFLRGGCPGQAGGNSGPAGGQAGGAVYLIAVGDITGAGVINASGGGGRGGASGVGGSGGGAGGMIAFDAHTTTFTGVVIANGGGGGAGGVPMGSGSASGSEPMANQATFVAHGGANTSAFGDGGDGSVFTATGAPGGDADPNEPTENDGGGGGGGGEGWFRVFPASLGTSLQGTATTSPSPM